MKTPENLDRPTYVDCNAVRLPHVWEERPARYGHLATWFGCIYCPVSTRTLRASATAEIERPSQYLPTAETRRQSDKWDGPLHG